LEKGSSVRQQKIPESYQRLFAGRGDTKV